jgi:hypothetical protein
MNGVFLLLKLPQVLVINNAVSESLRMAVVAVSSRWAHSGERPLSGILLTKPYGGCFGADVPKAVLK